MCLLCVSSTSPAYVFKYVRAHRASTGCVKKKNFHLFWTIITPYWKDQFQPNLNYIYFGTLLIINVNKLMFAMSAAIGNARAQAQSKLGNRSIDNVLRQNVHTAANVSRGRFWSEYWGWNILFQSRYLNLHSKRLRFAAIFKFTLDKVRTFQFFSGKEFENFLALQHFDSWKNLIVPILPLKNHIGDWRIPEKLGIEYTPMICARNVLVDAQRNEQFSCYN